MKSLLSYLPWSLLHQDHKDVPDNVEYILVGDGLPRTGTKSTQAALNYLLPGKCHHMSSVVTSSNGKNAQFWLAALAEDLPHQDWKTFVKSEGLSASLDFPSAYFWRTLLKIYPDAKVVLTDRDPVSWYHSVKNTIYQGCQQLVTPPYSTTISLLSSLFTDARNLQVPPAVGFAPLPGYPRGLFGAIESGEEVSVKFYNYWKAAVLAEVPQDRLLIFHVADGWEPLCNFLGLETPSIPFPRMNDTEEVRKMNNLTTNICHFVWSCIVFFLAMLFYYAVGFATNE